MLNLNPVWKAIRCSQMSRRKSEFDSQNSTTCKFHFSFESIKSFVFNLPFNISGNFYFLKRNLRIIRIQSDLITDLKCFRNV